MEAPLITSHLKQKNGMTEVCLYAHLWFYVWKGDLDIKIDVFDCQILKKTVIPEVPMFIPQFPLQGSVLSSCCFYLSISLSYCMFSLGHNGRKTIYVGNTN